MTTPSRNAENLPMVTIEAWEWDEGNLWKAEAHGYTPRTVEEVAQEEPKFRENLKGRAATHQMIGPTADGQMWTFCVLQVRGGIWRTVTGWPSTGKEQEWYNSH
jgi:hypothetical protein